MNYCIDVIIRAPKSSQTLKKAIRSLLSSTDCSFRVIFVDTGYLDLKDLALPPCLEHAKIKYRSNTFNYSEALNVAIPYLKSELTLVISSHTLISNNLALSYAANLLSASHNVIAATFSDLEYGDLCFNCIDKNLFNGFNGAWNTACLYKTSEIVSRPFNPQVFSSEDLEWSRRALNDNGNKIVHIKGCGRINLNPRKASVIKRIKDTVSVGYYSCPNMMSSYSILMRFKYGFVCVARLRMRAALIEFLVAFIFALAPFYRFNFKSGY